MTESVSRPMLANEAAQLLVAKNSFKNQPFNIVNIGDAHTDGDGEDNDTVVIVNNEGYIDDNSEHIDDIDDDDDDEDGIHHDLSTVHEIDSQSIESDKTFNTRISMRKKIPHSNGVIHIYRSDDIENNDSNNNNTNSSNMNNYHDHIDGENDEVIDDIDDYSVGDGQLINEMDITDDSLSYPPYTRTQINIPLKRDNQVIDLSYKQRSNKNLALSNNTNSNNNWKVLKPSKSKEYVLSVSPRPPLPKSLQPYTRGNYLVRNDASHTVNGFHSNGNGSTGGGGTTGGGNGGPFEYWTIPRNSQPHYKLRGGENTAFYMPGSLFLHEKAQSRSRRKGHRNVRERSEALLNESGHSSVGGGSKHGSRRMASRANEKSESNNNNNNSNNQLTPHDNNSANMTEAEKRRSELKVS
ncbi:unnamed protein product [Trichobilharzia regenti]|nr:unnamed protein product [Trichobilharzia regenti]